MPKSRPTSVASGDQERFEPKLLKAAEKDDVDAMKKILEEAISVGRMTDTLLRVALARAAERGQVAATRYLLSLEARTEAVSSNRLSPLYRAVEKKMPNIVTLLLDYGASTDVRDKEGRTPLMTAAASNDYHMLQLLISKRANVNAKDLKGRNVLHNLAADKQGVYLDDVVDLLLSTNIDIEGRDELHRTPLHWACATGNLRLAEKLITRPTGPRADINKGEIRSKTPLHIAAAHADRDDLVQMLIDHHANVRLRSDGGWTPLHNACEQGSLKVIKILVEAGADINARVLKGLTPLHMAAQAGHTEAVEFFLRQPQIKRDVRDNTGSTPFLLAAQYRRLDILRLLAPYNNVDAMSEDALGACYGFQATIVDFGHFRNENRVDKKTIYDLLYGRDARGKHTVPTRPENVKGADFRWIHLPANNVAWVEALLTKIFIEEGARDVEGFKHLEQSFEHQHRGQRVHSHFMRPLCTSMPRQLKSYEEDISDLSASELQPPPTIVLNGGGTKVSAQPDTPTIKNPKRGKDNRDDATAGAARDGEKKPPKRAQGERKGKQQTPKGGGKGGSDTPKSTPLRNSSLTFINTHVRSPGSPHRRDPTVMAKANICLFMPYLHYETNTRREEMQEAITRAESFPAMLKKAKTKDEMLIRAHLSASSTTLHVRRTLDQYFYHNIDTRSRDHDQVVYRYQTRAAKAHLDQEVDVDPKVLMVDQLWMWVLGKDLIVTSFPERWKQPKDDPLNVLEGVIQDINSKTKEPVRSVFDLALAITSRCSGLIDRHRLGDNEYQFLDMFESSIGSATDRETILFNEFNEASVQASEWLKHHRKANRFSRNIESTSRQIEHVTKRDDKFKFEDRNHEPLFVDKLLDIGYETDLLAETKDIRDELNMLKMIMENQQDVIPHLKSCISDIYNDHGKSQTVIKKRFEEQLSTITHHLKDIERMDEQAERIYSSITDLLDLKQKHANAFEARFARDQAAGTARQGQTIMVFTIVTIIFLPLSFIAGVFTINNLDLPHNMSLGYVSKYIFGIGFSISLPLIFVALSLDDIADAFSALRARFSKEPELVEPLGLRTLTEIRLEHTISAPSHTGFSVRRSVETDRLHALLPVTSLGSTRSPERILNAREKVSRRRVEIGNGGVPEIIPPLQKQMTGFRMKE